MIKKVICIFLFLANVLVLSAKLRKTKSDDFLVNLAQNEAFAEADDESSAVSNVENSQVAQKFHNNLVRSNDNELANTNLNIA